MTGFARAEGEADGISWVWELKSVNGRSLDLRLRLPPGFDLLEPQLRAGLAQRCRRGNVSASLSISRLAPPAIRINRAMLAQIVALLGDLAGELSSKIEPAPPRLDAHIAQAGDLLAPGEAVGRQLDFLCQELNREANTLCSKSADIELTRIGLALKASIEQFREQVQNLE